MPGCIFSSSTLVGFLVNSDCGYCCYTGGHYCECDYCSTAVPELVAMFRLSLIVDVCIRFEVLD